MDQHIPVLSIIVPCYNESEVLTDTNRQLLGLLHRMIGQGLVSAGSFVMYVNDGSRDDTWAIISTLCSTHTNVAGLNLAANVGHQRALVGGRGQGAEVADR